MACQTKSILYVVVWEWQNSRKAWRPYSPEVSQLLERGFHKHLSSLLLGDADPRLAPYTVNLSLLKQIHSETGETKDVRRTFLHHRSPPGSGVVWQWCGGGSNSTDAGCDDGDAAERWHDYAMPVQCVIEDAWAQGAQVVDISVLFGEYNYVIDFGNLTQVNLGSETRRAVRRQKQASYPVARPPHGYTYPGYNIPGFPTYDSTIGRREQRLRQQKEFPRAFTSATTAHVNSTTPAAPVGAGTSAAITSSAGMQCWQPSQDDDVVGSSSSRDETSFSDSADSGSYVPPRLQGLTKPHVTDTIKSKHLSTQPDCMAKNDKTNYKLTRNSNKNEKSHSEKDKISSKKTPEASKSSGSSSNILNKMLNFGLHQYHSHHQPHTLPVDPRPSPAITEKSPRESPPALPLRTHPPLQCSTPLPMHTMQTLAGLGRANDTTSRACINTSELSRSVSSNNPSLASDHSKPSGSKNAHFFSRKHSKKSTAVEVDSSVRDNVINERRADCGAQTDLDTSTDPLLLCKHSSDVGLGHQVRAEWSGLRKDSDCIRMQDSRHRPDPVPRSLIPPTPFPRTLFPSSHSPPYTRVPGPEPSPCATSCSMDSVSLASGRRASLETISTYLSTDDRQPYLTHNASDSCVAHLVDFSMEEPEVFRLSLDGHGSATTLHYTELIKQSNKMPSKLLVPYYGNKEYVSNITSNSCNCTCIHDESSKNASQNHSSEHKYSDHCCGSSSQEQPHYCVSKYSSLSYASSADSKYPSNGPCNATQIPNHVADSFNQNICTKDLSNFSYPPLTSDAKDPSTNGNDSHITALQNLHLSNPGNYLVPIEKCSFRNSPNLAPSYTCRDEGDTDDDDVFTSADQEVRQVMSATIARTKVVIPPKLPLSS
ncbi:uncharacterized protein LOC108677888 [Hyalella azteca]|uniref:E3 ubiquitin-protein ligase n=1 Tax=Hyalella azteca TaxID=294128 RepID=A0A8B7P6U5_HYAAZ|nr:uncharacterized protein LOC108677888 [Hyalella azteca]